MYRKRASRSALGVLVESAYHSARYRPLDEDQAGQTQASLPAEFSATIHGRRHRSAGRSGCRARLADGFIAGEQLTPGAPWQIRITAELRARIVQEAPPEYLPMLETTLKLGVSRQTVLQRVKRGELDAVLVRQGRRKGLRIKVVDQQPTLFEQIS